MEGWHAAMGTLRAAEVVFLATPFDAVEAALRGAGGMKGKVLVDCTNPEGPGLTHGLKSEGSGSKYVQSLVPGARVVKAFTIYGFETSQESADPGHGALKPAM